MLHRSKWILSVFAVLLIVSPNLARADKLSDGDKDRLKPLVRNLETVAQESRLARDRADSDGVRHFAELALKEHDAMIREMHSFCEKHDFAYDADPTKPDEKELRELNGLKGKEFDRVYMSAASRELDQTLGFLKEGAHADDHDLRKWCEQHESMIEERLANAKELYRKVKEKE